MHIARTLSALTKTNSRKGDQAAAGTQVLTDHVDARQAAMQKTRAHLGADRARPYTLPKVRCANCSRHRQRHGHSHCAVAHMDVPDTRQERQCLYFETRQA